MVQPLFDFSPTSKTLNLSLLQFRSENHNVDMQESMAMLLYIVGQYSDVTYGRQISTFH